MLWLPIGRTQPELEFEPVKSVCMGTKKTIQQVNAFATEPDSLCLAPKPLMAEGEPTEVLFSSPPVCLGHMHAMADVYMRTNTIRVSKQMQ